MRIWIAAAMMLFYDAEGCQETERRSMAEQQLQFMKYI